jgi:leader peptidase (prepilin peptidase)/N-methyltransferase
MVEVILALIAGLLAGSFLNVCAYRLPRDLTVTKPARSFCPECEKTIAWYDNIPLLSFLILRGRCRDCAARIPWRYPLLELATGAAFAVCVAEFGVTPIAAKFAIFGAILLTLIATDFETQLLPNEFTLGGLAIGIVFSAFVLFEPDFRTGTGWARAVIGPMTGMTNAPILFSVSESVLSAAVAGGMFWFVGWLYEKVRHREGLGLGDVKMLAMIAAFLSLPAALLSLMLASFFGAIGGLGIAFATRKQISTYEVPFGVYLGVSAIAIAVYGRYLMAWYSHLGA